MKNLTLQELAKQVGVSSFPEIFSTIFDEVVQDFNQNGCLYTSPDYYDMIHEKYGVLESYLDLYKKAAVEIGKDKNLSLVLALLCRALRNPDFREKSCKEFKWSPKENDIAYEMLPALAAASEIDIAYNILKDRNLPEHILRKTLQLPEYGIPAFTMRNNNRPGYAFLDWYQLPIDGKLFELGRLQYEISCGFEGNACVFRNKQGEEIAFAEDIALHKSGIALGSKYFEDEDGSWFAKVKETEDSWEGYPLDERGMARNEIVSLPKSEWEKVLAPNDPVISLHIPATGRLNDDEIEESLQKAIIFFREYFPEYKYNAFVGYSWILDPQVTDLLDPQSNISKFNNRFKKVTAKCPGESVFSFVYLKPNMNFSIDDLPENTTLERAIKKHYQEGKAIYRMSGYFFK